MQLVVDNILTNYEIIGEKNKKPLLILHGWQRSADEWIPAAKQLSEFYQVIILDLPGFGKTTKPNSDFSIYEYATFVEHFLDKLELKKTILLGHSVGARIGIILGAKTERIEKLILVSPAGIERRKIFDKLKIGFFKLGKFLLPSIAVDKLKANIGSDDYRLAGEMRGIFLKIINEDLSSLLPRIHTKTLIIWGSKDNVIPLWKIKQMKKEIPNVRLKVLWETGHFPHFERSKDFIEIIKENL
jgi:pimeloyl-ACP methyl ester carboxylesterase